MDKELYDLLHENLMGDYAHAGLGIALGLALGPVTGLVLGHLALGLALGIAIGLIVEVILEMQDHRRHGPTTLEH